MSGADPKSGKTRRPAHQNKFAFKHNKNSVKTKKILQSPNQGLCRRCTDQIEWRKRYRKYKVLTAPAICLVCSERKVKRSYHVLCDDCAIELNQCGKCRCNTIAIPIYTEAQKRQDALEHEKFIASMSERQRRSYYRQLRRQRAADEGEGVDTSAIDEKLANAPVGDDDDDDDDDNDSDIADADGNDNDDADDDDKIDGGGVVAHVGDDTRDDENPF